MRLRQLGSPELSWRDLLVIVREAPRDSPISRAVAPELSAWGLPEELLAQIVHAVQVLAWQGTEDAQKRRTGTYPRPIPRPGLPADESRETKRLGSGPVPIHELEMFIADFSSPV